VVGFSDLPIIDFSAGAFQKARIHVVERKLTIGGWDNPYHDATKINGCVRMQDLSTAVR